MPYTKTNWVAGDTVTSEKLNKIENALNNISPQIPDMVVTVQWPDDPEAESMIADKTYQQISAALNEYKNVVVDYFDGDITYRYPFVESGNDNNINYFEFSTISIRKFDSMSFYKAGIAIYENNNIEEIYSYPSYFFDPLRVPMSYNNSTQKFTLQTSAKTIYNSFREGMVMIYVSSGMSQALYTISEASTNGVGTYWFNVHVDGTIKTFVAQSDNANPVEQ